MKTFDFTNVLDTNLDDIEYNKPLPEGAYLCTVASSREGEAKSGTPFIEFTFKVVSAYDGVNPAELEDQGGIGNRELRATFWLTERSLPRLKRFFSHLGLTGMSIGKAVDKAPNREVIAYVKHEISDDGEYTRPNVSRTASAS